MFHPCSVLLSWAASFQRENQTQPGVTWPVDFPFFGPSWDVESVSPPCQPHRMAASIRALSRNLGNLAIHLIANRIIITLYSIRCSTCKTTCKAWWGIMICILPAKPTLTLFKKSAQLMLRNSTNFISIGSCHLSLSSDLQIVIISYSSHWQQKWSQELLHSDSAEHVAHQGEQSYLPGR